jgi:hypothetical protein
MMVEMSPTVLCMQCNAPTPQAEATYDANGRLLCRACHVRGVIAGSPSLESEDHGAARRCGSCGKGTATVAAVQETYVQHTVVLVPVARSYSGAFHDYLCAECGARFRLASPARRLRWGIAVGCCCVIAAAAWMIQPALGAVGAVFALGYVARIGWDSLLRARNPTTG